MVGEFIMYKYSTIILYLSEGIKMGIQKKLVLFINGCIILVCLIIGAVSYFTAEKGFEMALNQKAESDLNQIEASFDQLQPGDWVAKDGKLYKGNYCLNDTKLEVDHFKSLSGDNITFFCGPTRIATSFTKEDGSRVVGTEASEVVQETVLKKGEMYVGQAEVMGNNYLTAYKPIKDAQGQIIGMLFAGIPTEKLDQLKNEFIFALVGISVVLLLVVCVVVTVVAKRGVAPLREVEQVLGFMAAGDLTQPDVVVDSRDEIGSLASSMNLTKKKLQELLSNINSSAQQVAAASEELTASADQTVHSVNMVADNTVHMAEDVAEQTNVLGDIRQQSQDMGTEMAKVMDMSHTMQRAADDSRQGAVAGRASVERAIKQMEHTSKQIAKSAEVVSSLGERSEEIGQIVDAITNITSQTNLLALNAAIEAARAGEAGRGFAVVAEEVRKLAEESAEAAQNISVLIGAIRKDTEEAVQAMSSGQEEVKAGTRIVEESGTAFKTISELVDQLYSAIEDSKTAVTSAHATTNVVMDSVQNVERLAQDTSEEAQSVSAATEEQTAMIHEMAEASRSLADLAQNLQDEVAKFKM